MSVKNNLVSSIPATDPSANFYGYQQIQGTGNTVYSGNLVDGKFLLLESTGIEKINVVFDLFQLIPATESQFKIKVDISGNKQTGILATTEIITGIIESRQTISVDMSNVAEQDNYSISVSIEATNVIPVNRTVSANFFLHHKGRNASYEMKLYSLKFFGNNTEISLPVKNHGGQFNLVDENNPTSEKIFEKDFNWKWVNEDEVNFPFEELEKILLEFPSFWDIDRPCVGFDIVIQVVGDNNEILQEISHHLEQQYADDEYPLYFELDMAAIPLQNNYSINVLANNILKLECDAYIQVMFEYAYTSVYDPYNIYYFSIPQVNFRNGSQNYFLRMNPNDGIIDS